MFVRFSLPILTSLIEHTVCTICLLCCFNVKCIRKKPPCIQGKTEILLLSCLIDSEILKAQEDPNNIYTLPFVRINSHHYIIKFKKI